MVREDAEKPKVSEVVSIVAHQLKNPISILKGFLEVLLSEDLGKINEKQKEYLEDSLENLSRMRGIVNYLLDISRIEEGKYQLKAEGFSLEDLIREVVNDLSLWAKASNSKILFKVKEALPWAFGDSSKIRQVIENLISNSLKYRNAGPGKIEIAISERGKFLLFSCRDNGISVQKEDLKKVFSKFYRSEKAVELDPSGTGLGLHINKAIIEMSRGKIWFEPNKNRGITFYFTIPHV
ncbi:MAG: HAMP domain-containing sensor histidine kinase [bacterium]|nr:HAMP domain-containing sensor histidine kinase [bacterium]